MQNSQTLPQQHKQRLSLAPLLALLVALLATLAAEPARAANFSPSVYDDVKQELRSVYRHEKHQCMRLSGNAKDVCKEEVEGREEVALAQLKYNYTGSSWDALRVEETSLEARYEVAKERCDSFWDVREDACEKQAWDDYDRALRETRTNRKADEPPRHPEDAKRRAEYAALAGRCQSMPAGHGKDVCEQSAKAQYGVN